jgi:hypothetical protein
MGVQNLAVTANLTYDGNENRWKALQASGIYDRRAYLTEVYRNILAREVHQLGYEIENCRDSRGRDTGFEIRGIPKELLAKYSQRSKQRDEAINRFIAEKGRKPSDNEIAVLVRESRSDKLVEISTPELRRRQRARLAAEETQLLSEIRYKRLSAAPVLVSAELSLQYAQDHVFERVSVALDHHILSEALRHGRGQIDHGELKGKFSLLEISGKLLRCGKEIATRSSLQREHEMIQCINRGIGGLGKFGGNNWFLPSPRLTTEQVRAVEFVLNSRDRFVNISGAAGTGKTATLQELHRGLLEAKHEVLAIAPTASAVDELKKVGFSEAVTLERLLQDRQTQEAIHKKVIILDEAGMVSGRQMLELLHISERNSARIVFSGDTKQIQSVEACDALRVLEKESRLKSVGLTHVKRQVDNGYRQAIKALRTNPETGFEKLDAIGAIHEVGWLDRAQAVAHAFSEGQAKGESTLLVCATHDEIDRVTETIRSSRKQKGELKESIQLSREIPLNWTTAQKRNLQNFHSGQFLGFHRSVKGIAKNETVEVLRTEGNRLMVRNGKGENRTITANQANSFDVFEKREIDIAAGDRLLLKLNCRERGFRAVNGEIVTVKSVNSQGIIQLSDGRILPSNYRQFDFGYAVTAHCSQGKSVDSVIISADGMQKELFYVAASRGRKSIAVITSNKEQLRESVSISTARLSASELARKSRPGLYQGMWRGLEAARGIVKHLTQLIFRMDKQPKLQKERKHEFRMEPNLDRGIER